MVEARFYQFFGNEYGKFMICFFTAWLLVGSVIAGIAIVSKASKWIS